MDLVVCVPARNEAARLPTLLEALAAQSLGRQTLAGQMTGRQIEVVIALNNTTDNSLEIVENARSDYRGHLRIHIENATFAPDLAHAGSARRLAMNTGLALLSRPQDGILVSTDADTRPPPQWLDATVSAFARGADVVGGRIVIDSCEEMPHEVAALRRAQDAYWDAVREIEDVLDPLPWNPAPRHGDHTGASLALRGGLYARCGGVPLLRSGEDRALVAAATACGGRLAHPADVFTFVSSRRDGRAEGGMAQAMQEIFDLAASGRPLRMPDFGHWRERALWRRRLRARPGGQMRIAQEEQLLPPMPSDMILDILP
ncbi:MAG: glycosyltransferase family A protein [Novosphingobium sp.]